MPGFTDRATERHVPTLPTILSMITGSQIRAGRALLGWSSAQLAEKAEVHYATVSRAEQIDGVPGIKATTLHRIQQAMEMGGVLFLSDGDLRPGGPGVRLRA